MTPDEAADCIRQGLGEAHWRPDAIEELISALSAAPAPDKAELAPPASWPPDLETTAEERASWTQSLDRGDTTLRAVFALRLLRDIDKLLHSAPPASDVRREDVESVITGMAEATIARFIRNFRFDPDSDYTYQQQIAAGIEAGDHRSLAGKSGGGGE